MGNPGETVAQAVAYGLLHRYDLWKIRCSEVLKIERPAEERCILEEVKELKGRASDVGAGDRALFAERTLPEEGGDLGRMKEWVRAVRGSIRRREEIEQSEHNDVRSYFGRGSNEDVRETE